MNTPISQEPSLRHRLARVSGQALVLALLALPALLGDKSPPPPPAAGEATAPSGQPLRVAGLVLSEGPLPAQTQAAPRPAR